LETGILLPQLTRDRTGLRWRDALTVAILYAASHVLYGILGVRFDAGTFPHYMQFIDQNLLSDRLIESLWYYHANPPLLNLFVGIGLKLFGAAATGFFSLAFHVLGVAAALSVYALTLALSRSSIAAALATGLMVFSPSFVLYENWLMYSFPAAGLLVLSAAALHRYVATRSTRWAVGFFSLLAALLLTRSLFHLAWLVMVALLLTAALWPWRRQVLLAAAVPILVVALWYGKNYYLFGTFSSSTWFGLGFSNISTLAVTRAELEPLIERGELSQFALISRYHEMDRLFTSQQLEPTGIAVLDQVRKSSGEYNFNNQQLLAINRYYTADGIKVVQHFPASYVIGLIISNRLFFSPSNMNLYFDAGNRAAVRPMEAVFNPLLYGVSARPGVIQQPHFGFTGQSFLEVNTSLPLFVAWWLLLAYGYSQARRAFLGGQPDDRPRAIVIGFIVFTMLYIYGVGTAFELAENYRYRWVVEPITFVLAATALTHLVRIVRVRLAARRVEGAST
jgi:hypothetical protein